MRFAKGHGTGNDFIIVPDAEGRLELDHDLIRRLCDRRTGIGADGVLRVVRTAASGSPDPAQEGAEWFMDYRNADGSIAEMCGNGIRVFARYLIEERLAAGPELAIGTRSGLRLVRQTGDGSFTVAMGPAVPGELASAVIGGSEISGIAVNVGNPHLACLVTEPVAGFDLSVPPTVDLAVFPDGVNVELVRLTGDHQVQMRVHERGSGETLSCGTGAVAAAMAAAVATGELGGGAAGIPWTVDVPGGRLTVAPSTTASLLTGPAQIVAEGEISASWLAGHPALVTAPALN